MIVSVNFLFVRIAPFVLIASVIGVVLTYKEVKMEAEQEKKINKKIGKTNYENRTARNFFVKYFDAKSNDGYHNFQTDFRSYFLSFDDDTHIEIMNKPEMSDCPKELTRTGYAHIAFSVGSKEKVDTLTAELKADGYEVVSGPRKTGDGYYESCIVAFEDNQIEITV